MKITKAVIPVAGLGTRLLPATKAIPKEMFPLAGLPAVQHIVEEAVAAGITDVLFVTSESKPTIQQHFSRNKILEVRLKENQQEQLLSSLQNITEAAHINFVNQPYQDGLGSAIYQAKSFVGQEPFSVLLGDAVMLADRPVTSQLIESWSNTGTTTIGIRHVEKKLVTQYGIISGQQISPREYIINNLIEKPTLAEAPSQLAIAGRYILTAEIFGYLLETPRDAKNEIPLTTAMQTQLITQAAHGYLFDGQRFDIGNHLDYLRANIAFTLSNPLTRESLQNHLNQILDKLPSSSN